MGSITFDQPLDQTVTLDPDDFVRGIGGFRRQPTAATYSSATTISFTGATVSDPTPLATGWYYTPGVAPIKGLTGVNVAAFGPYP